MAIYGNAVTAPCDLKTVIMTDDVGNEIIGVVMGEETVFDANRNDVREGKTFAGDEGVTTGNKNIPSYRTRQASYVILPDEAFSIPIEAYNLYNYTKFQCIIAEYNTSLENSVSADRIVVGNNVYGVNSLEILASVTKNENNKSIDLNIINNTNKKFVVHYFLYKEEI